jgi:hypothetical protein
MIQHNNPHNRPRNHHPRRLAFPLPLASERQFRRGEQPRAPPVRTPPAGGRIATRCPILRPPMPLAAWEITWGSSGWEGLSSHTAGRRRPAAAGDPSGDRRHRRGASGEPPASFIVGLLGGGRAVRSCAVCSRGPQCVRPLARQLRRPVAVGGSGVVVVDGDPQSCHSPPVRLARAPSAAAIGLFAGSPRHEPAGCGSAKGLGRAAPMGSSRRSSTSAIATRNPPTFASSPLTFFFKGRLSGFCIGTQIATQSFRGL